MIASSFAAIETASTSATNIGKNRIDRSSRKQETPTCASDLRKRFVMHVGPRTAYLLRRAISIANHAKLMAHLDLSHTSALSIWNKLALVQNKVMFCLLRFTNLSAERLCHLQLCEIGRIEDDLKAPQIAQIDSGSHKEVARRSVRVRIGDTWSALDRFVLEVRPKIVGSSASRNVFISPYTGQPLTASASQGRFKDAVLTASLETRIHNINSCKLCKAAIRSEKRMVNIRRIAKCRKKP